MKKNNFVKTFWPRKSKQCKSKIAEDGFRCSSKHCRHEMLKHGSDYDFYDQKGDCESCKSRCWNDSTCAGVECDRNNKCVWWKHGECGTLTTQSRDDPYYKTCMKYDEGKSIHSGIHIKSSNSFFI